MLALTKEHIIDLYVWVDELLPKPEINPGIGGRPRLLSQPELVTLLVWNSLTVKSKTLKDIYAWARLYHESDFPRLPQYKRFVENCHQAMPDMVFALQAILASEAPVRIMDSTMLPVCKLVRAERHKVAKSIADFGRNWQGWHYGFKMHASIDLTGKLSAVAFTKASIHDAQVMPKLLNEKAKLAVGDTHYGASVMGRIINKKFGTIIIAPPHWKQNKKLLTLWQHKLLTIRPKIECMFDYLKEHLHLVSSFPRSVAGYFLHYLRILLAYQIMAIS